MSSHFQKPPVMEIEGKKYTFKRLGAETVLSVIDLCIESWKSGNADITLYLKHISILKNEEEKPLDVSPDMVMLFTINHMFHDVLDVLSKHLVELVGEEKRLITREELDDADLFPAAELVKVIVAFTQHPDVRLFTDAIAEAKQLPFFQALSKKIQNQKFA